MPSLRLLSNYPAAVAAPLQLAPAPGRRCTARPTPTVFDHRQIKKSLNLLTTAEISATFFECE